MPLPTTPAQTTGGLAALVTNKREAVVVTCALISTSEGDILADRLNADFRHALTGWKA